MLQRADLLGMVRTEDLARTVPTNSSQPPSLWPMQWSASLWLLSFNKAFSIIIHSVFVKLGNVSYGQDFTLEAILFRMLELDSHRYGAGASLWPKKWTHEQQLSQKTTFSPIVIFSIPFLESYLLDQDILHWQQKILNLVINYLQKSPAVIICQ